MLSWIGKLFGSDKAAKSLVDNLSSGIDKIWYTDQEKSEDKQSAIKEANQVYMQWLQSTSGSSIARRFIAIVVTIVWASQYVFSLVFSMLAPWMTDPEVVKNMMETSKALSQNGEQGNAAFMVVLGFYFLGNKADAMFTAAVEKMTGNKSKISKEDK